MPRTPLLPVPFEVAGGSVVGTDHRAVPRNNQDAWHVASRSGLTTPSMTVAAVCDGCGSGAWSEVGARLGARLICESLRWWWGMGVPEEDLRKTRQDVLARLGRLADAMGGGFREVLEEHFLLTVVGVVLTEHEVRIFALGDGVYGANGDLVQMTSSDNAPPYLAYALLGDRRTSFAPEELLIKTVAVYPADEVESFLIGCDGAGRPGLLEVCEQDRKLPGMEKTAGPISQFWTDDAVYSNPAIISRRLKLIARDWPPRDPEHGLLPDDTTIVVGRRRED